MEDSLDLKNNVDYKTILYSCSFNDLYFLESINLPDNITKIYDSCFSNNESLTSITIPENVTSIGNYAFRNCKNLSTITCKAMIAPNAPYNMSFDGMGTKVSSGKKLRVPEGATGYDSGNWKTYVLDKGYTLEYVPLSEL